MKRIIVKMQRTLDGGGRVLIYSEDRVTVFFEQPLDAELAEFMGPDFKLFAYCYADRDRFVITHRAPWQDW